ncbi:uncharacterized protein [Euwallacea fornicatus]|uniref:uncharacterized protein isoform X1 n=1 Tax=Euwallacea fornicatus TaxID=995702 RepID=UPI00338DA192
MTKQIAGYHLLFLLVSSSLISTLAYPNSQPPPEYKNIHTSPAHQVPSRSERKFAEKSNVLKKVPTDLDDIQSNDISQGSAVGGGFSWSNLLGAIMQMIFNPGGINTGPPKSDNLDDGPVMPTSPWANLLSVALKILTAILGGGAAAQGDGFDKIDNGASPLQGVLAAIVSTLVGGRDPQQVSMMAKQAGEFINIVVNLLDALKTSFSHRSMAARNIGRKDSISDAAVAGLTMAKGYVRSLGTEEDSCMAKYICQANSECSRDVGQSSLFCNIGSYAASFMLDKSGGKTVFDLLYEAGRRGRSGDNCKMGYLQCNEVY